MSKTTKATTKATAKASTKATAKAATTKAPTKATTPTTPAMPTPASLGLPAHVVAVLSLTKDGKRAKRVMVRCQHPEPGVTCLKTRECASQDAFQVKRCEPCQARYLQTRRNKAHRAA